MEGWSKIYFPLLAQQRTAAWLISTDHAGGVMECLERKHEDPDQNALKFQRMSRVCKECYAQGKSVYLKCRHLAYLAPYFQSPQKMDKLLILYEAIGALEDFEKENLSLLTPDSECFFNPAQISKSFQFTTAKEYPTAYPKPHENIYVGCDPSGGGTSYFAITAGWYSEENKKFFVELCSVTNVREDNNRRHAEATNEVIQYLRKRFPRNKIVVACENAPVGSMQVICDTALMHDNVYVIKEGHENNYDGMGVAINRDIKSRMFAKASSHFDFDMVALSPTFEAMTNLRLNYRGRTMATKRELVRDMMEDNYNAVEQNKGAISGKKGSKDPNIANDDVCMSGMYFFWCHELMRRPDTRLERSRPEKIRMNMELEYARTITPAGSFLQGPR